MSGKRKVELEEVEESTKTEKPEPKKAPVPIRRTVSTRKPKLVSFDVWAKKRGIKDHHKGGMRAYVKNPDQPRTEESWDKLFTDY